MKLSTTPDIVQKSSVYSATRLPFYPKLCIILKGQDCDNTFYEEFYEKNIDEQHQIILVAMAMNNLPTTQKCIDSISWFDIEFDRGIYLKVAIYNKAYDVAFYLIRLGADVGVDNNYVIQLAAAQCENSDLLQLIIDCGADIHVNDDAPICYAAYANLPSNVKILLQSGANINACNGYLLTYYINQKHHAMVEYLLDSGIDITDPKFLSMAIDNNNFTATKLLLEHGADSKLLEVADYITAVQLKSPKLIELLVTYGADFTIVNNYRADDECRDTIDSLVNLGVSLSAICNIFGDS